MAPAKGYFSFPTNKPSKTDFYLVSVNQSLILKLGLAPSPNILIAKYNLATQEWATVLGSCGMIGNINNEVIAWAYLPLP